MFAVKRASPSSGSLAALVLVLLLPVLVPVLVLGLAGGPLPSMAAAATVPPDPAEDSPIVTLADGRNLDECISAMPKPDCRTSTDTDAMQIAVFSLLIGALVLIGWRIVRATRQRDRAAASAGPP